jgi:hypothetical protein
MTAMARTAMMFVSVSYFTGYSLLQMVVDSVQQLVVDADNHTFVGDVRVERYFSKQRFKCVYAFVVHFNSPSYIERTLTPSTTSIVLRTGGFGGTHIGLYNLDRVLMTSGLIFEDRSSVISIDHFHQEVSR